MTRTVMHWVKKKIIIIVDCSVDAMTGALKASLLVLLIAICK